MNTLFVILALTAAALESCSYPGFIRAHTGIPAVIIYLGVAGLLLLRRPKAGTMRSLLLGSSGIILVTYIILKVTETVTYPNFIYTRLHLNLQALQTGVLLTWLYAGIWGDTTKDSLLCLGKNLLIASLILVTTEGVGLSISFLAKKISLIIKQPFATYEEKMNQTYPGFYPAMELVKQLTPKDALILIPPQENPWEVEGNAYMVSYFLYPRQVQNLGETFPATTRPLYVLIAKGSWVKTGEVAYGWPKRMIPAKHIWKFDLSTHTATSYEEDYLPARDAWDWGLIEVKYE